MSMINYEKLATGGGGGTLQTVTDAGNTTTNAIGISNNSLVVANGDISIGSNSGNNQFVMNHGIGGNPTLNLRWKNSSNRAEVTLFADAGQTVIGGTKTTGTNTLNLPTIDGILATYQDENGNLNYAGFFIKAITKTWGNLSYDGTQGSLELVSASEEPTTITATATAPRTLTIPDKSGIIVIQEYYEAQLIVSKAFGTITIVETFNNSPYTFSGSVVAATTIRITPSAAITTILPMCGTGTTLSAPTILTSALQNGSDIDIEHTASGTNIDNIQLNLKMII